MPTTATDFTFSERRISTGATRLSRNEDVDGKKQSVHAWTQKLKLMKRNEKKGNIAIIFKKEERLKKVSKVGMSRAKRTKLDQSILWTIAHSLQPMKTFHLLWHLSVDM